jgi:UDP-N-acetylglucosamine 2-epimerase
MLSGIESILLKEKPDLVLIYGDTNSTLAGALASVKLRIPIAHIEAGVRIYDIFSPEEANRVIVSHIAQIHFCCTQNNVKNLKKEGIKKNVYWTGDVMFDAFKQFLKTAELRSTFIEQNHLKNKRVILATFHRPENVDNKNSLGKVLVIFQQQAFDVSIIFPLHPRTKKSFKKLGLLDKLESLPNVLCTDPISYLDTLSILTKAEFVLTDSGGLQREAFFAGKYSFFSIKIVGQKLKLTVGKNAII